jgi:hypothetical protein
MLGLLALMRIGLCMMNWNGRCGGIFERVVQLLALDVKESEKPQDNKLTTGLDHIPSTSLVPYLLVSMLLFRFVEVQQVHCHTMIS